VVAEELLGGDRLVPHMDGEALARHMAETKPNLPVVLISGNREPTSALIPGLPWTFQMKPVTRETLRAAIAQVTADSVATDRANPSSSDAGSS
jgi:DNA-binding NtrC family response regulator